MVAKKGGAGPKAPATPIRNAPQSIDPGQSAGWAQPGEAHMARTPAPVAPTPEAGPPPGRAVALGRDGKPIWRQNSANDHDPYANAGSYAPHGWTYEWKRGFIYNQPQATYQSTIARVGKWSEVPHERHPGIFGPLGAKGSIVHEGLILMERPTVLHMEAVNEEKKSARDAKARASRERGLQAASAGVDTNTPAAKAATFIKESRALEDEHFLEDLNAARPAYDRNVNSID